MQIRRRYCGFWPKRKPIVDLLVLDPRRHLIGQNHCTNYIPIIEAALYRIKTIPVDGPVLLRWKNVLYCGSALTEPIRLPSKPLEVALKNDTRRIRYRIKDCLL
jgi:hypothetical protein